MSFYLMKDENFIFIPYNIIAIDFEFITTKIIENRSRKYLQEIVEIGMVYRNEDLTEEYSYIIKPRQFIKYKNKQKSVCAGRFFYSDIQNGIDLSEAFDKIKKIYVPKDTKWISWGKSEYDILKRVCSIYRISIPFLKEDYLDLSQEFSHFYKMKQRISLDKALSFLNISIQNRHNALPDAKALVKIMDNMFYKGYRIGDNI